MAGKAGEAFVEVLPELKRFGDKLSSDVDSQTRSASSKLSSTFTKVGAGMTAGLTVPIVAGFTKAFGAFAESATVQAQTQAVLKSTGGAANITAKQVDALATSVSKYGAVDDEAVAAGENMLLTFTNVRNETGKGNAIFNRSTKILADMSQALGTDMPTSAIQLGKALNDPIKGVTALRRVGVSFDDQQTKTIEHLEETGHVMDAQKIILRELTKEFGGSAKEFGDSAAGGAAKAQISIENAMESIGAAVAPAVEWIAKLVSGFTDWITGLPGPARTVIVIVLGLVAALGPLLLIIGQIIAIAPALGTAASVAFGPWGIAIAAAIVAIVLVIKYWKNIKRAAVVVWNAVKNAVVSAWHWIVDASKVALRVILGIATGGMSEVVRAIVTHWSAIKRGITNAWDAVLSFLRSIPGRIIGFFADAGTWLFDAGKQIITGLWDGIKAVWHDLTGWIGSVGGWLAKLKGPLPRDAKLLQPHGRAIMGGLEEGLRYGLRSVEGLMRGVAPGLSTDVRFRAPGPGHLAGAGRAVGIAGTLTLTPQSEAYVRGVIDTSDQAKARHARTVGRMGRRR